jgi:hypothetical protein
MTNWCAGDSGRHVGTEDSIANSWPPYGHNKSDPRSGQDSLMYLRFGSRSLRYKADLASPGRRFKTPCGLASNPICFLVSQQIHRHRRKHWIRLWKSNHCTRHPSHVRRISWPLSACNLVQNGEWKCARYQRYLMLIPVFCRSKHFEKRSRVSLHQREIARDWH